MDWIKINDQKPEGLCVAGGEVMRTFTNTEFRALVKDIMQRTAVGYMESFNVAVDSICECENGKECGFCALRSSMYKWHKKQMISLKDAD